MYVRTSRGWVLSSCVGLIFYAVACAQAGTKHGPVGRYPGYEGLVMAGYQGWFRAPGDGSGRGWGHFGRGRAFNEQRCTIDFWPDVSEYEKTYETSFKHADGTPARVFSSRDASTTDLHFKWMRNYGVDGVFMQRFTPLLHNEMDRLRDHIQADIAWCAERKVGYVPIVYPGFSWHNLSGDSLKPAGLSVPRGLSLSRTVMQNTTAGQGTE